MSDADASAAIELEDDSLTAGLDAIASRFAEIASQINSQFGAANTQLARTATTAQSIGLATAPVSGFARVLLNAANAGRVVATSLAGIATTAARVAPLVKFIPDSLGKWVAPAKAAAAEHGRTLATFNVLSKSVQAVTGRLSVLNAGFMALSLNELGASKGMAALGAAGALATSKIVAGVRSATGALRSLPAAAARAGGSLAGSLGRSASTVAMVASPLAGMALALGPVGAAAMGAAAGFSAVKRSVGEAAEIQTLQTSFVTLLGSVDAAKGRMAELSKFAADTPFDIPGITKASRVLETLTKGALSTGAGLTLVGDSAAVSGEPVDALAVHIGRLYDGLQNGRAVGESLARLQELGLVSATTRGRIEALQKAGEKGNEVWEVAAGDLKRFSGEMARQSGTWNGLLANAGDSVGNLFRAFGAPVITALTPFLQKLIGWIGSLEEWAGRAGTIFAGWSALIAQIFSDGKMGEALSRVGKIAFMEATNFLVSGLAGAGNVLATVVGGVARQFVTILAAATTAQFWQGVGNALKAAGAGLVALLLEGVSRVLDMLRDMPKIGEAAGRAADKAHGMAGKMAGVAAQSGQAAGVNLAPLFADMAQNLNTTLERVATSFTEGRAAAGEVFDTGAAKAEFMQWLQPIAQAAQDAVSGAAKSAAQGGLPLPIADAGALDSSGKKGGSEIASLQKIGGGGGFSISKADPLLAENRNQTKELQGLRSEVKGLREALTKAKPGGAGLAVFS